MRLFLHRFPALGGLLLFAFLCTTLIGAQYFRPDGTTITVTNTADIGGGSLRNAIAATNDGDTIQFDPSLDGQTITLTSAELIIGKSITISGPGPGLLSVSRNQQAPNFRILHVTPNQTVTISGLTISGGHLENANGAGIFNDHATLTLSNCTISGNDVTESVDPGAGGGGIFNNGTLSVVNSSVSNNHASGNGGGIGNEGALEIFNSSITGNDTAWGYGGGISGLYQTITNCTISLNVGFHGGGIAGGGNISHTTFSYNFSPEGGSIYAVVNTVELGNNILNAGTSKPNLFNNGTTIVSHGYNLSSDDGSGFLTGPGDQINTDPLLSPLQDNGGPTQTHDLLKGSPAIDAGDPNFTPPPSTDQRGYLRVYNKRIDIGSVEVQPTPTPGPATHFAVVGPASYIQYFPFDITVTAQDQFNNTATGYAGTVHFTSSSSGNGTHLPADSTLTNGSGTFSVMLGNPGSQTITATDTIDSSVTGTSNPIIIFPKGSPTATATFTPTATPTATATATATGTPPPTPTPTPPATPSPEPTVCGQIITFNEKFDGVIAPALPPGWVSSFTAGPATCIPTDTCALGTNWATSTTTPYTPPNCAFHNAPGCVTDSTLDTPTFSCGPTNGVNLSFRQSFDLENGRDGAVLEISTNGGPFVDFEAAGGSPGYNGTISSEFLSPIAGRRAWTGNSGGYLEVFHIQFPPSALFQNVRLRFRLATDCSGSGTGWRIDNIRVEDNIGCETPTPTPSATPAQLLNLSTRLLVQTGAQVGIGGFIIIGSAPKQILLRGIGPSLGSFGVPNALADPILELHGPAGFTTITNDNWRDVDGGGAIQGTGLAPTNDLESAILVTLVPGNYTAILKGKNDTSGVGLVELYDLSQGVSQLANISTRAFVGTGGDVLIGGFILGGSLNTHIVVRGLGPSLAAFGVPDPLPDPTLELRDSNGGLLTSGDTCSLPPPDPVEACIDISLPFGAYTATLAGKNGGTGVGLIEIYNVQ